MKISEDAIRMLQLEAAKSNQKRAKMSAMILDRPLLRAYNYNIFEGYKLSIHAEEHLIIRAARVGIPLEGMTMIVYRANGCGVSRPCKRCWEMITKAGLGWVIWFDGDGWVRTRI